MIKSTLNVFLFLLVIHPSVSFAFSCDSRFFFTGLYQTGKEQSMVQPETEFTQSDVVVAEVKTQSYVTDGVEVVALDSLYGTAPSGNFIIKTDTSWLKYVNPDTWVVMMVKRNGDYTVPRCIASPMMKVYKDSAGNSVISGDWFEFVPPGSLRSGWLLLSSLKLILADPHKYLESRVSCTVYDYYNRYEVLKQLTFNASGEIQFKSNVTLSKTSSFTEKKFDIDVILRITKDTGFLSDYEYEISLSDGAKVSTFKNSFDYQGYFLSLFREETPTDAQVLYTKCDVGIGVP